MTDRATLAERFRKAAAAWKGSWLTTVDVHAEVRDLPVIADALSTSSASAGPQETIFAEDDWPELDRELAEWFNSLNLGERDWDALMAILSPASAGPQAEAADGHGYSGEFTAAEFLKRADEHDKAAANGISAGPNVSYVRTFQACAAALRFAAEHMFAHPQPQQADGSGEDPA